MAKRAFVIEANQLTVIFILSQLDVFGGQHISKCLEVKRLTVHEHAVKIEYYGGGPIDHAQNRNERLELLQACTAPLIALTRVAAFCVMTATFAQGHAFAIIRCTNMAKAEPQLDVLVLGDHPAAYLCAALLKHKGKLRVLHSTLPGVTTPDRLVLVNPELFSLHPLTENLRRKLDLTGVYGLRFLAESADTASEHRARSPIAYVATAKAIRNAMIKVAEGQDVEMVNPKSLVIHRADESGVEVSCGKSELRPKLLVLGGLPPEPQQKLLGLPDGWGPDVVHRYTFLKLAGARWADLGARPVSPMSLNLHDMLYWAWMLPGDKCVQLAVEQPVESLNRIKPRELLLHWAQVLRAHQILISKGDLPLDQAQSIDIPFGGALAHEGVANRTLLIGPAGGFFSATSEDIYPNCWSAVFAADAVKKALKEVHLQDALQPYRHKWRTTLGDYLRGPQQNLRFLLPLVYRNQVMTTRLAESILTGSHVVR
jgi:flavin-dependent dehydrogenase